MAMVIAVSTAPIRDLRFRPSPYESGSSKLKEHRPSLDRRRISQHAVNRPQFYSVGPTVRHALVKLSASEFDSPRGTSFSSSLLRCPLAVPRIRKRPDKGSGESAAPVKSSLLTRDEEIVTEEIGSEENVKLDGGGNGDNNGGGGGGNGGGGGGEDAVGWISSALIFAFWAGLIFYTFTIAPNQTQYRDTYFIEKLIGLHPNDGFTMNKVLVTEFYFMGLWPIIYSSLLIPNGRSSKGEVKVWPFAATSFAIGAFALLPYFGLWRPPPPAVSKDEASRFPLNILESKITAVATFIGGIILAWYAGSAGREQWAESVQYLQESKLINVMSVDFCTLSALAPFWVYNDLSARQRFGLSSWMAFLALIPLFGPALYLILRPPLATIDKCDVIETNESASSH